MQIYPPRPLILSKPFATLTNGRADLVLQVPKAVNFYIAGFFAVYPVTVAANIQTTDDLKIRAYLQSDPKMDFHVPVDLISSPGNRGILRSMVRMNTKVAPGSVIQVSIEPMGYFTNKPANISLAFFGRAGWEMKK